jgi:hypothetical protein
MAASIAQPGSGPPPGGGADGGWRAHAMLSVPAFAWEFLRRNVSYRAEYQRWSNASGRPAAAIDASWGLRFAVDPELPAAQADVFWRPEIAPGVVVPLEFGHGGVGKTAGLTLPEGTSRAAEDGLHVRLKAGLQLLLRGETKVDGPLVVMLGYDADLGLRVRAVETLERAATGRPLPKSRLTAAQRTRLARCLIALDGSLRRDSYRTIAQSLFGHQAAEDEAWRTASVRGVTIRLVQAGRVLMNGGYLSLLRGGL